MPANSPDPEGIGGWLLFFCIFQTIVWPLYFLADLIMVFSQGLRTPLVLLSHIVIISYGISTGVALWRTTKGAVKNVRIFLIVSLIFAAVPFIAMIALGSAWNISVMGQAILTFLFGCRLVIWFPYFSRSRRVANTFASDKATADVPPAPWARR